MKLTVLGLSLSSSWGNGHATTYRALLKALARRGHDITFYERDQPWYAANRDLAAPDYCRLVLYRSLKELGACMPAIAEGDAAILGSYVTDGIAVARMLIEAGIAPLAFYDIDTPVTLGALAKGRCAYLTRALVPAFDLYLSFSGGRALHILEDEYGARRAAPLQCSVDTEQYRPLALPKRWALGYLGTYSADREAALERLLIEPARRLPDLRFVVAGAQYADQSAWPANVDRIEHVPPARHPAFYAGVRFALNVTRSDMIRLGHSPSVRLFEAGACATPVISDPWPGLDSYFSIGRQVLTAETTEDVVVCLTRMGDAEAAAIGRAARARVTAAHEASIRARQLEGVLRDAARQCIPMHRARASA